MGNADRVKDERRERLAEIQAEQRRAERRRSTIVVVLAVVVALALVVPTVLLLTAETRRQAAVEAAAKAPIAGAEEFEDFEAGMHTTEDVTYEQSPPVGGEHHPTWQNCGYYPDPVVEEHAVHSMEHGAVWVTYDPALPAADVEELRELAERYSYALVSPREGLQSPVVASAWGIQVELDGVADERLEPFVLKYVQGEQTPELGAACHGGVGA